METIESLIERAEANKAILVERNEALREILENSQMIVDRAQTMSTIVLIMICLLYTSPSPRDRQKSRMPSSA